MSNKKPLILISNDDGYQANGIRYLVDFLRDEADILVCAPDGGRSGYSRAFSAVDPLTLRRQHNMDDLGDSVKVYSCSGTPVDCVKIAYSELCKERKPDLVLGGINHGDNSTVNNHYSGTVGIAIEGALKHIPSIAFSSCYYEHDADFSPLRPYVRKIVKKVLEEGLPKGICLNVNFPARQHFEGVKACRMTFGQWVGEIDRRHHVRGYDYYWVVGSYVNEEQGAEGTDQWSLDNGFVAITPTQIDVTAYDYMNKVEELFT